MRSHVGSNLGRTGLCYFVRGGIGDVMRLKATGSHLILSTVGDTNIGPVYLDGTPS